MALLPPDTNTAFDSCLHKATAEKDRGTVEILKKDHKAPKITSEEYSNPATDLYEFGFGQSFHFYRPAAGESFVQGIARHEHYLASTIGIKKDMRVLDVGCGVGGSARESAKFTGCRVTGVNINKYQVQRAEQYARKVGMGEQLEFVQGDFMHLPFPDASFDAAVTIEATVHAPSLRAVYAEILRTLKPGEIFGLYEWVMTDTYDNTDLSHHKISIAIEQGDGIARIARASEALAAMRAAGFEVLKHVDHADRRGPCPWYWPLDGGSWRHAQTVGELFFCFRMTRVGRILMHGFLYAAETAGLAPLGATKTSGSLCTATDPFVLGGTEKLFTPMLLMVGRKPS